MQNAHPVLRMFTLCEQMKWNHLPEEGGLYAQDPDLLDGFMVIFHARGEYEEEERKRDKAKSQRGMGNSRRVAGRR